MKKDFIVPSIEVIKFPENDFITTSGGGGIILPDDDDM